MVQIETGVLIRIQVARALWPTQLADHNNNLKHLSWQVSLRSLNPEGVDVQPVLLLLKWLHRSAHAFGKVRFGQVEVAKPPELPGNFVLGTHAANMLMLRYLSCHGTEPRLIFLRKDTRTLSVGCSRDRATPTSREPLSRACPTCPPRPRYGLRSTCGTALACVTSSAWKMYVLS